MTGVITNEVFFGELKSGKRYIPVSIDVQENKMKWLDFEQYHFYEGFFHKSINLFSALKKEQVHYVVTDLDILFDDRIREGCLYPAGFIFHASRSGSTLLAKVLARSAENHVISEAEPLNSIWKYFAEEKLNDNDKQKIFTNLVLAFGRPGSVHQNYFIKFTSFNILFFEFIHPAFPDVPAIFMRRDIEDILKSFNKKLPGWLQSGNSVYLKEIAGIDTDDPRAITQCFFEEAGKYPPEILMPVEYKALNADLLPTILHHFNVKANESQLSLMQKQFLFDSKVELNQKKFGHK
ncbi:MAG TPA: sulfotransferase [Mucilaginibacter sp.]